MRESHKFETVNGATVTLDPSTVKGQRFTDGNRNVQVHSENLAGGTYSVYYRFPSANTWIAHVENATEKDSVILAGKEAPLFEAVQVRFFNIPNGTTTTLHLTTWERGL